MEKFPEKVEEAFKALDKLASAPAGVMPVGELVDRLVRLVDLIVTESGDQYPAGPVLDRFVKFDNEVRPLFRELLRDVKQMLEDRAGYRQAALRLSKLV